MLVCVSIDFFNFIYIKFFIGKLNKMVLIVVGFEKIDISFVCLEFIIVEGVWISDVSL